MSTKEILKLSGHSKKWLDISGGFPDVGIELAKSDKVDSVYIQLDTESEEYLMNDILNEGANPVDIPFIDEKQFNRLRYLSQFSSDYEEGLALLAYTDKSGGYIYHGYNTTMIEKAHNIILGKSKRSESDRLSKYRGELLDKDDKYSVTPMYNLPHVISIIKLIEIHNLNKSIAKKIKFTNIKRENKRKKPIEVTKKLLVYSGL